MGKKIKITEDQMNEFVDKEGSIASGDYDGSDSKIRTNYYRKNKRPQTSDDFADETGLKTKYYNYVGFGVSENVDMQNNTYIPDYKELSKSYEQPNLQRDLSNITSQLSSLGVEEEQDADIKAIVLKQILLSVDYNAFSAAQKQELQNIFNNGK